MPKLFDPLSLRGMTLRNRIAVTPMCMYSAKEGVPNDWHAIHLGSRAVGGAGLIVTEATGVEPEGRITPFCTGIYNQAQIEAWKPITDFSKEHGAAIAIQLAHAGRKGSHTSPFAPEPYRGLKPEEGAWETKSSTDKAFGDDAPAPHLMSVDEIKRMLDTWAAAAKRSVEAGFEAIELHAAHGYLVHQFLSPLCNDRTDEYGGEFEGRTRFAKEVVQAVRSQMPGDMPLFVRLSVTDFVEGGWDVPQSIRLSKELKALGVDFIDCSSGGVVSGVKIQIGPGYQVPLAEAVREGADIPTGAVGLITEPSQAQEIIESGKADLVLMGRASLRDPYWPRRAAAELGESIIAPQQYERGWR